MTLLNTQKQTFEKMNAIYHYKEYFNGDLIRHKCKVEIIRNDKKTYLVKLLQYCGQRSPGELMRAHKKNISF